MEFGEKLRTLRREKGLSQEELAAMVGVSRQALSKWEAGQSRPELDKLLALSDVFSVTMDSLVRPAARNRSRIRRPRRPWAGGIMAPSSNTKARGLCAACPWCISISARENGGPAVFWPSAMWLPVWCPLDLSHAAASPSAS